MVIDVFPPRRGEPERLNTRFALQQDNWNDYSFQTLYHLFYQPQQDNSEAIRVGPVKILRRGQTGADTIQLHQSFERLPANFCSVGASLDYYQRLSEVPTADRAEIMDALRDVVARPALQREFEKEPGWGISLFRDNTDIDGFLADATAIYANNYSTLADLSEVIEFRAAGWSSPLTMNFSSPEPLFYTGPKHSIDGYSISVLLPKRIIAVIGRNGSGKSTLLSRMARVAFAAPSDRLLEQVQAVGSFEPSSIGFMRVIAISYSAFDNFAVPAVYDSDLRQISTDVERGGGRYVYAGLRDIVSEARDDLLAIESTSDPQMRVPLPSRERQATSKLKSLDQLADEFVRSIDRIDSNGDGVLFDAALEVLLADQSFADIGGKTRSDLLGDDARASFMGWSTGHKIALHVLTALIAHATRRSLILFDEPETHLHPPLTAALLSAIRVVLEVKNALAVVATHSPVVLQETLAQHVRIVTRVGDHFSVEQPPMETFGENVGILTQSVFGLTSATTDFHNVLDLLVQGCDNLEQINEVFSPSLSGQALAYVMAGLARKAKDQ